MLKRLLLLLALLAAPLATQTAPVFAHKEHQKALKAKQEAERQKQAAAAAQQTATPASNAVAAVEEAAEDTAEELGAVSRSLDWMGRLHPMLIHFPIALFPVAWVALILARRRRGATDLIRAMIVVAGSFSLVAAALGWLNGGVQLSDPDLLQALHRWLGTVLGIAGAALALWAWRRAGSVDSRAMVWSLGVTTLALMAQGWLGGALVHGADHLAW